MQIKALFLSMLAATAAAAPKGNGKSCPAPPPERKFGIMSLRSASPVHFGTLTAADNKLWIHRDPKEVNAKCDKGEDGFSATFFLRNGELFLYGKDVIQQFYVDRSGMGQGNLGYFNKGQSPPRNSELSGWAVDQYEYLTFDGSRLLACPNKGFSYVMWVESGIDKPAGVEGCLSITAMTLTEEKPVKCTYSTK